MTDKEKVIRQWEGIIDQIKQGNLRHPIATTLICDTFTLLKEQKPVEQEAVKPHWTHPTVDKNVMMCGSCGIEIPLGKPNYCPWCGRRVDWNE